MTPSPTSSSTGHSPPEQATQTNSNSYRVVRKRNRVPLSCAPCRNRKLKCNRSHPCENCIRRADPNSCTYAMTPHNTRARKQSSGSNTSSDEMQSRIDRLEGLVLSLMGSNGSSDSSPRNRQRSDSTEDELRSRQYIDDEEEDMGIESKHEGSKTQDGGGIEEEVEEVRSALGIMKVEQGKSYYRGETHWAAILSEISEVKNFFNEMKQTYEGRLADLRAKNTCSRLERTGFPFSAGRPPGKEELLALVPRQDLVDLLVDTFFRNYDPIFHVLHRPTFYKQYEDFWRDPSQVDMIWLGLLMSIMCLSLRIYNRSGEEPQELVGKTIEMSHAFKAATEQCLIVGDYSKKLYIHTIQTLILLVTQNMYSKDRVEDTWLLLGSLVRLALCMGLHRDPKNFPQISPGEGEIRKRLWTIICCMDILESIKIGLPSMIRMDECDTGLPLNLHDDEIIETSTTIPQERGREELTGVSYMIAKASLSRVYAKIVAQASSLVPRPAYDQILKADTELRELYGKSPTFLHLKTKEESKNDPAWLVIQRYNLDLIVQKALVTLHRPYAARAQSNPRYQNSRRKCVDAAMTLLKHQSEIFLESQSTLRHARWFTESLGCHDFLHAAMIICLDLSTSCKERKDDAAKKGVEVDCETWKFERTEQFRVLESTKMIYENQKESSMDCVKAYGVLCVMLDKLRGSNPAGHLDLRSNVSLVGSPSAITPGSQIPATDLKSNSALSQGTPCTASAGTPATQTFTATPSSTSSESVDSPNDPLKSEQAAAMTLGMMSGGGMTPGSAAAGMMLDRAVTPGGTNILMGDASNGGYGSLGSNGNQMPFNGNSAIWTPNGPDMTANLDWDDWDSFMQGINMDTSQSSAWPVLAGLSTNMPMTTYGYPSPSSGVTGTHGDDGGGGGGGQSQQSSASDTTSPNTIPSMAGLYQPL
ncbi:hypothetical protein P167DRAFT_478686 [Morchella conica CCBAS932]|uniref:Zn(2)-C6 fungal-type domain-containing protein n=1 Tax=Morchella conica CCBAS932 TaxID=1392247 RepID=A0A3N4L4K4_9PEZI|nr:hypothetical protein P167DRAFT_478686 [Morchella conica CCBAS932]